MQKLTPKAYAIQQKMSLFHVIKAIKSGKLESEVVTEEGKEVTYVLLDEKTPQPTQEPTQKQTSPEIATMKREIATLQKELLTLKREMIEMKKSLKISQA